MHLNRRHTLSVALLLSVSTAQAFDRAAIERGIKAMAPDAKISEIRKSPVPGLVEVVLGAQIVYVSEDGEHLLNGSLYATASREDLSERSKAALRATLLKDLPKESLISFGPQDASARVTVFTAIDCGYCKQLHQQIDAYHREGIAIDYVLIPRGPDGSPVEVATRNLHCAADPAGAFSDAVLGLAQAQTAPMCPAKGYEAGKSMAQRLGINSTPTIVFGDGSLNLGYLSPADLLTRLRTIAAR